MSKNTVLGVGIVVAFLALLFAAAAVMSSGGARVLFTVLTLAALVAAGAFLRLVTVRSR